MRKYASAVRHFGIDFPAAEFLPSQNVKPETQPHPHSVLLVDDDKTIRNIIRSWVDDMGFQTREAESAEEALDELDAEPAHIAVCDVNMPGRSGVWLASQIRERFPDTAIVMATAARDIETAVASLRNEVFDYLLKTFDRDR